MKGDLQVVPTVGVVAFDSHGKFVLVEHLDAASHITGTIGLPAGRFEEGETAKQAAVRELEEETGLVAKEEDLHLLPVRFCATISRKDGTTKIFPIAIYTCDNFTGDLRETDEAKPIWLTVADLEGRNLLPNVDKIVEHATNCRSIDTGEVVLKLRSYLKEEFVARPHYSFGDPMIMVNHCLKVEELALRIAEQVYENVDLLAVRAAALLHDIGKTYEADPEVLNTDHELFNLKVAEQFIDNLGLPDIECEKVKEAVRYHDVDTLETRIVKDADTLSFYADERYHKVFYDWVVKENREKERQRKYSKFEKLRFPQSREIGQPLYESWSQTWAKWDQERE